jgi:hypothetical protein
MSGEVIHVGIARHLWHRNAVRDEDGGALPGHVPFGVRLHTALHHDELDRDLATGVSPETSRDHELRAQQLLSHRVREQLAYDIDAILARAEHPPHWHSPVLPVQEAAVKAARTELLRLREALVDDARRSCRGVAMANLLLNDLDGPVYGPGDSSVTALAHAANAAFDADASSSAH